MKKKIRYILLLSLLFVIILCAKSYARITTNDPTVESGGTVTITVNSQEGVASGAIKLTSNGGLTLKSATGGTVNGGLVAFSQANNKTSGIATYTFTVPTVTANTTYKVTFSSQDMADEIGNPVSASTATSTVTVKAKTTTNPGGSTSGNNGGGSTGGNNGGATTVTEPKFTSANKTVYATGDINLRSSWSTSSSATKISKGTELKLTGTSTQKVNGYVWYRVTYNGQTKYVSRDLITETKPEEKSNNTNLKLLSIEGVELTPAFSANITEYSAKLTNYKEQSLKINAEAEDSKSTVKIEGNEEIKIGENVISVTVTAEDGTTKVYKITITNEEKEGLGLSSLVIKGVELKNFSPSKFNYEIEFKELDQLEIEAIANEEGATVEIVGNENLTELGEHIITIIVTSADGEQIATYTITANKLAVEEAKQELDIKSILTCAVIALVVLVAIIILIVRYVKGNSNAEIDYVYNDNLDNKENEELIEKENNKIGETPKEETKKDEKPTIDDLYADYDDEPKRKRGKGRHSK